jgi:hypothetical protein
VSTHKLVFYTENIAPMLVVPFTMPPSLGPLDQQDVEDWLASVEHTTDEDHDAQNEGSCLGFLTCTTSVPDEGSCLGFLAYTAAVAADSSIDTAAPRDVSFSAPSSPARFGTETHRDVSFSAPSSPVLFVTKTHDDPVAGHAEPRTQTVTRGAKKKRRDSTAAVETPRSDHPIEDRRAKKKTRRDSNAAVETPRSDHQTDGRRGKKKTYRASVGTVVVEKKSSDTDITKTLRHVVESFHTPYLKFHEIQDIAKVLGVTEARVRNFCNNYRKRYSFYNNNTKTPAIRQQGDLPTRSYVQFMTENIAVTTQTVAGLSCCDELQCTVCLSMGSAVASQTIAGFSWCEGTQCTVCFSDGSAVISQTMAGFPWCESDATVHSGDPGEADGLPR